MIKPDGKRKSDKSELSSNDSCDWAFSHNLKKNHVQIIMGKFTAAKSTEIKV